MADNQTQGPATIDSGPKRVYFTGYVAASATQLTSAPSLYDSLFYDDAPNAAAPTQGIGKDATQCLTATLGRFAGVIVSGEPQIFVLDSSGKAQPGWAEVVQCAENQLCNTHANATIDATYLAGVTGQWYLAATNAMTAAPSTTSPTVSMVAFTVGLALETANTSSTTAATKTCLFGSFASTKL